MSVAAQSSIIAIGRQASKVGSAAFVEATHVPGGFYKIRAPRVSVGPIEDNQDFPMEVGGDIVPTGAFKQGVAAGGTIELLPRSELSLAMLAYFGLGAVATTPDVDLDAGVALGANVHTFTFDTLSTTLPWMALRKVMHAEATNASNGETLYDCKVASLQFVVPNRGKVLARVGILGRDYIMADDTEADAWTYTAFPSGGAYEDSLTVPEAGRGYLEVGGVQYPALGAQITLANQLTGPQQEQVIGSFKLDDIAPLGRRLMIQFTYKWQNADLWRKILNGGVVANDVWDSAPFFTSGANAAFEARFLAPKDIPTTTAKYGFEVQASKVVWRVGGYPELAAGGIIMLPVVGTVIDPGNGDPYARIRVVTDADWPAS